jgi:hypothetical protein
MDCSYGSQIVGAAVAGQQLTRSQLPVPLLVLSLLANAVPAYHVESVGQPHSQRLPPHRE